VHRHSPRYALKTFLLSGNCPWLRGILSDGSKRVEGHGFPVIYLTGGGTVLCPIWLPDIALPTMTETADSTPWIYESLTIPVFAEAENGYTTSQRSAQGSCRRAAGMSAFSWRTKSRGRSGQRAEGDPNLEPGLVVEMYGIIGT
jgi:2-methylisocitrate lyase-like PEP mutase family enzyme